MGTALVAPRRDDGGAAAARLMAAAERAIDAEVPGDVDFPETRHALPRHPQLLHAGGGGGVGGGGGAHGAGGGVEAEKVATQAAAAEAEATVVEGVVRALEMALLPLFEVARRTIAAPLLG